MTIWGLKKKKKIEAETTSTLGVAKLEIHINYERVTKCAYCALITLALQR